jgi:hypothetical protein
MKLAGPLARLYTFRGSTRSVAVLRMSLAGLLWADKAETMTLYRLHQLGIEMAVAIPLVLIFHAGTLLLFVGRWSRLTALLCGATGGFMIFYLGAHRGIALFDLQYTTLLFLAVLLLAFTPCGGSYSLDRLVQVREAERSGRPPPLEEGDLWGLRIIGLLVSSVYFWAAYDKVAHDYYLRGFAMEYNLIFSLSPSDAIEFPGFHLLARVLGIGTVLTESFLAVALWIRRLRPVALVVGLAFHAAIHAAIPMGFFSFLMAALYLVFVPPDAVHRLLEAVHGPWPEPAEGHAPHAARAGRGASRS